MKETSGVRRKYKYRKTASPYLAKPPAVPAAIDMIYLCADEAVVQRQAANFEDRIVTKHTVYKPGLLAAARVTFRGTRWQIHLQRDVIKVIALPLISQMAAWEKNLITRWEKKNTRSAPDPGCLYALNKNFDFSVAKLEALQEEFAQFLISTEILELFYNSHLKILRTPDETNENFVERCLEQIRQEFDPEMRKVEDGILIQQERLRERLEREIRERSAQPLTAHNALSDDPSLSTLKAEIAALEGTRELKRQEFEENFNHLARQQEKDFLRPGRSDVEVTRMALVWLPYTEFIIQEDDRRRLELVQSF